MKKSIVLLALPLLALAVTGCEKKNRNPSAQVEASIILNKTSLVLEVGGSETLTATTANGEGGVTWASSNTDVATVDANGLVTAVARGNASITATYSGKTATCQLVVRALIDHYALASVQDNEDIKDFKNNVASNEWRGETEPILQVGDDNPLNVRPVLKLLNLDTFEEIEDETIWNYAYEYELKMHNGESYVDPDQEYGVFDAQKCTFDFNDAAIGKRFKLSVRPGGLTDAHKADALNTKTVELDVNNGWNVYSADELAYFNDINFLDADRQDHHPAGINAAWAAYRTAHGLDASYVAPSVFLQKTIKITRANLPDVFFYNADETGGNDKWVGHMKDCSELYCHYADGFTFNGNYFHLDTTEIPFAIDDPSLGYTDNVSHSTLFKISYNQYDATYTTHNVSLKHCSYLGNAPRGEDVEESDPEYYNKQNCMGLIFFKINNSHYNNNALLQATFDTFNVKGAVISFFSEVGETKMIINNCAVQEGYSNGFYLWNNGIVDIHNSLFKNFGGPVFITDGDPDHTVTGFKITSDAVTVFDNWVTGNEPWFAHTKGGGPKTAIPQIQGLDGYVQGLSNALSGGTAVKTFLKLEQQPDETVIKLMNFIIINYGDIPDVTFQKGSGEVIGVDKSEAMATKRATVMNYLDNEGKFVLNTDDNGLAAVVPDAEHPGQTPLSANFGGEYLDVLGKMPGFGYLSLFFQMLPVTA